MAATDGAADGRLASTAAAASATFGLVAATRSTGRLTRALSRTPARTGGSVGVTGPAVRPTAPACTARGVTQQSATGAAPNAAEAGPADRQRPTGA